MAGSSNVRTIVLVGRTGNGKSATGNTILGRRAFVSKTRCVGSKSTSELQSTVLKDGKVINVIDTPGIFDASAEPEFIGKEMVKCLDMAKDGIHAVVVVLSVRNHFSKEEEAVLHSLTFFCPKITDYMTVVVTGRDELEDNDENFEDYLLEEFSEPLQNILKACKNRCVLFDNKTKDIAKKEEQLSQLFFLVDAAIEEGGGLPYTSGLVEELKKLAVELRQQKEEIDGLEGYTKDQIFDMKLQKHKLYAEQLQKITEKVTRLQADKEAIKAQSKIRDTTNRLEEPLINEQLITHNPPNNEKEEQLSRLFILVDAAIEKNGGLPYTSGLVEELKKLAEELRQQEEDIDGLEGYTKDQLFDMKLQMHKLYEEQLQKITEKVQLKIRDTTKRPEEPLINEHSITHNPPIQSQPRGTTKRHKEPLTEEQLITHDTMVQSKRRDTTQRMEEPPINEQFITHNPLNNEKEEQLSRLFIQVDEAIEEIGGLPILPYTSGLVEELKKLAVELRQQEVEIDGLEGYTQDQIFDLKLQMHKLYADQLQKITEKVQSKKRDSTKRPEEPLINEQLITHNPPVQSKRRDTTQRMEEAPINEQFITHNPLARLENVKTQLQEKIAAEKDAWLKAENFRQAAQQQSEEEIKKLKKDLKRAEKESREIENQTENPIVRFVKRVSQIKRAAEE